MKKSLNWFFGFWAFNGLLAFLISLLYLLTPSTRPDHLGAALFVVPYFSGHLALLYLLLIAPLGLVTVLLKRTTILKWILSFLLSFLHTLLLIDTFVYQQYRFHINLFVLDLFFNAQGQVISFSWYLWFMVFGFLACLLALQIWVSLRLERKAPDRTLSWLRICLSIWFLSFLSSHLIYAWYDAHFYRPITKLGTIPPFPFPLNAQDTLAKWGVVNIEEQKNKSLMSVADEEKSQVHYPLENLKCANLQAAAQKMNVLFIMMDSVRADALNPEVMPEADHFSKKAFRFMNHFSGSNSTRGGVFSFFYGLPPLYFDKFRETRTSPVLLDQFHRNQYEFQILSSAPLTKPEFDQTIFSKVQDLRKKSKAQPAWERDLEITNLWLQFTEQRDPKKPFFGFLFYDSAHEFSYDPQFLKFKPQLEVINYFTLNNDTDPTLFLNRYHNSVHYIDVLLGRVFRDLEQKKLLSQTIVILTADHGKEFNDNKLNYWGHNSNFTDAQTKVPFFIYWPGKSNLNKTTKTENLKVQHWTDHYDLVPTLMEDLFHCQNKSETYASGQNLLKHQGHDWILHGTYGDFGIRLKDHFIVIKLAGGYEVLNLQYQPVENFKVNYDIYNLALKEMRRFFK